MRTVNIFKKLAFPSFFALLTVLASIAQAETDPLKLPRLTITDLKYAGAFRLPADHYGESELNFSEGPIEYDSKTDSIYIVGHTYQQAIAVFKVPKLVKSTDLSALNMAGAPTQSFAPVLDRTDGGNSEDLNRIGGLGLFYKNNVAQLVVNAYEYYDAPADNSMTTLVIRDASDLAGSVVNGFYEFQGGAGHTSGWISPIPSQWQEALQGDYITGHSSGIPIISRCSVGPSAFSFKSSDIAHNSSPSSPIPTKRLLDFSLDHPLSSDLSNDSRDNHLWTHLSRVTFGVIIPGTRTYLTVGYSGGNNSGVCYKCSVDGGSNCGGYCAPDSSDNYQYYWLWDVADMVDVLGNKTNSYDPRPYDYGILETPFATTEVGGGSYDPESGMLYLSIQKADSGQGDYANPPVIVVYEVGTPVDSTPAIAAPKNLRLVQ